MKRFLSALVVLALACTTASAEEWGNLSGTFVYDGVPPKAPEIDVDKDVAVCGMHGLVDEDLLVDEDTGGIANVVVYLYLSRNDDAPAVHPDDEATAEDMVHLDNENCRFEPHVCVLRTSQTLVIGNPDPIGHNTKIDPRNNDAVNLLINSNDDVELQFPNEERLPVALACTQHPWMQGYLVVKDHPFVAVSDEEGHFEIPNLPVGTWTFQVWQEKSGYVGGEVKVDGEEQDWGRRGQFEITIKEGDNDMGEILIPASVFE